MIQSTTVTQKGTVIVEGTIAQPTFKKAELIAPNAPDRITSYSGSALPFPCSNVAFDATPNRFAINSNGIFRVEFVYPNSFYLPDGRTVIKPSVFLIIDGNVADVKELPVVHKMRSLNYRYALSGMDKSLFHSYKDFMLPVGSADSVMREYKKLKIDKDVG